MDLDYLNSVMVWFQQMIDKIEVELGNWRLPVLRQSKGIIVDLLAELANVVADLVLDLGQLGLCLLRHFNYVKLWINVTCKHKDIILRGDHKLHHKLQGPFRIK